MQTGDTYRTATEFCANACYQYSPTLTDPYPQNTPCAGFTIIATNSENLPPEASDTAAYWSTNGSTYQCSLYSTCQAQNTDDACPATHMPKSFVTTRCTEDTQAHNCANGRDYCCTDSTANVVDSGTATCKASGSNLGTCGSSSTGYATGFGPPNSTKVYDRCPNNVAASGGKQNAQTSLNCKISDVPSAAGSYVTSATSISAGCCSERSGAALQGLINPSNAASGLEQSKRHVALFAVGLTHATTGARAKCQSVCNSYTPVSGGWDCNGFDVRLAGSEYGTPPANAGLTAGSWLTAWETGTSPNPGHFICTLYKECLTSSFNPYGDGTNQVKCQTTNQPKAYVGNTCTRDTAWFECPYGRPHCCTSGADSTNACVGATAQDAGTCSYYPPPS